MIEPPKISPEPKISLENELEQRILALREARRFNIGEEDKKKKQTHRDCKLWT